MLDLCALQHYFIVFHPGSAGNFVSNVTRNIVKNSLNDLEITTTGSAHATALEKVNEVDHLACGTFFYENSKFTTYEEKLNFHQNRIKNLTITEPQINWTHDFTNIPLYKTLFPNCKILVITQETVDEKLATTILQVHKNFLDKAVISPISSHIKSNQELRWEKWASDILSRILKPSSSKIIPTIIQDRFNPLYKDLIEYVTIYGKMKYYNLLQYINDSAYEKDLANTVLYPVYNDPNKRYTIGKDYDYYTEGCVKLSYNSIMHKDATTFLHAIENLIGTLDSTQQQYTLEMFDRYCNAQNKNVLINPKQYFLELQQRAFNLATQL